MAGVLTCQIPFPSLSCFAARYGIDDDCGFEQFIEVMRRLDASIVSDLNSKK